MFLNGIIVSEGLALSFRVRLILRLEGRSRGLPVSYTRKKTWLKGVGSRYKTQRTT